MSKNRKNTPAINIISFKLLKAVALWAFIIGFLIKKRLVIFGTIGNKRPVNNKKMIRPANAKKPTNVEKLVVIYYEHWY